MYSVHKTHAVDPNVHEVRPRGACIGRYSWRAHYHWASGRLHTGCGRSSGRNAWNRAANGHAAGDRRLGRTIGGPRQGWQCRGKSRWEHVAVSGGRAV